MPYNPPILVKKDTFGKDTYADLEEYIIEKVEHLERRLQTFRSHTLSEYVRLYKGRPRYENVEWPWEGASNLTVPLVGTYTDELLSRIMGGIWMYDPLWTAMLAGDTPDKDGEDQKEMIQTFLSDMSYDPDELDLYRVENGLFQSASKYGTGVVNFPWEYQKEIEMLYIGGGLLPSGDEQSSAEGDESELRSSYAAGRETEIVVKDGPHPEMVPLNRWGFDPAVPNLGNMRFMYHIESLDYWQVKDLRGRSPYYKQEQIDDMLLSPDALQEDELEEELNRSKSIEGGSIATGAARWYIYHLCFSFRINMKSYWFFARYWKQKKNVLFITFNNYPRNIRPYEDAKLAYDEESYLGTGFAELVQIFQRELSNNVNWRTNNRNYAMLGVWRIDPGSKLSSILDLMPGVAIPARKDEVEWFKTAADVGYNNAPDEFVLNLAKERAGIDPAVGGAGGGVVNAKRGVYSAAGTSMVLGQSNNRNNLRTSDMRSAHAKIGNKFGLLYSNFGVGDRLKRYGDNAEILKKALENFRNGVLGLRLRPSSAALNKELDRQNDVMLTDRVARFHQQQAQQIEAMMNPQCPPPMKEYFAQTIIAGRVMMQALLRTFNKQNVDAYLPQVKNLLDMILKQGQPPQAGGGANAGQAIGGPQAGGLGQVPQLPNGSMGLGGLPAGPELSM